MRRASVLATVGRVAPWQSVSRAGAGLLPILVAAWFGRSAATDLYALFTAIFTMTGALIFSCFKDSALIPVLMDLERRRPDAVPRLVGAVGGYALLAAVALAVVMGTAVFVWARACLEPALVPLAGPMAAGFSVGLLALAVRSLLSALLAARFRFVSEAVGVAFGAAVTVGLAAATHRRGGVAALPWATAAGELVAAAFLAAAAGRAGVRARLDWRRTPELQRLARLVAAEIGGAAVVRVNPLVDQVMAQALGIVGGGTMLRLSGDLGHAGTSFLGPVFLSILLSHLAEAGAARDHRRFHAVLRRSLVSVGAALGALAILGTVFREPLVRLVYGRGAMDAAALARMAELLPYHLAGMAPLGVAMVLARAHVSLGNSRILIGMGTLNALANLTLNFILVRPLGLAGIALSTSLVSAVVAVVFWVRLRRVAPRATTSAEPATHAAPAPLQESRV